MSSSIWKQGDAFMQLGMNERDGMQLNQAESKKRILQVSAHAVKYRFGSSNQNILP